MTLSLFLLRHGQTALSRDDDFCGSGLDPELTENGLQMADAFAAAYRAVPWKAIYTSGLRRTIATAQPLCDVLKITMRVRTDLNEIGYGKWEGLSREEVERVYKDDYYKWLAEPSWHSPTGGELAVSVACRALRTIEEIKQEITDGNVLVVSHKATIRIILSSLLGIDLGNFRHRLACPVGSVTVVEFTPQGPLLQTLADRSHLSEEIKALPGT